VKLYPPARPALIAPGSNDPRIQPVGVILHVAATNARSLHDYFDGPSGGIESHLYLRRDGTWEQYRDLEHEADANYKGNSWITGAHRNGFISVETQGLGSGEWTDEQLREIRTFLLWASAEFSFPLRRSPSMQPASPAKGGVGYHTMYAGWSNVPGKVCPGPNRIKQFDNVLVPWMKDPEEDNVTPADIAAIAAAVKDELLGAGLRDQVRQALDAELGDESGAGAFSDRVAEKVAAKLGPSKTLVVDPAGVAAAVADTLSQRLKG
jgi:hypothetical protein